jgi:hypothetical protein
MYITSMTTATATAEFTASTPNVRHDSAWVTHEGIGICGECAVDEFMAKRSHWDNRYNAEQAFGVIGIEPSHDEWCSICDKDTN